MSYFFTLVEGLEVVNVCLSWFNKDNSFDSNRVLFFSFLV